MGWGDYDFYISAFNRNGWYTYITFGTDVFSIRKGIRRCLIGSSYASGLGISSICIFIDYSAHLFEFVLFV